MKYLNAILLIILSISLGCNSKVIDIKTNPSNENEFQPVYTAPEWSKNANIYEVNIRQYTPEGTFNAFKNHLPRLKDLGVDILWLMPIHPIGVEKRKGEMGSPYSIKDYTALNPDFGTNTDFRSLVNEIHALGMKIIMDWVPNHSSFDNKWITQHPDWYTKDEDGNIIHPANTDWTDVADLNYDNDAMRAEMTKSMVYWVEQFDIDGYRCDVAGEVPNDFWMENNRTLQSKKHLFLLAEWDNPSLHQNGFHMTYGWGFHHVMNTIAQEKKDVNEIRSFLQKDQGLFQQEDYRMNFITNHDENSWNGTIEERMGAAGDAFAILAFTVQGMPLIYSGQEAGLNKRLSFFGKDQIDWSNLSKTDFYKRLLKLKHDNAAIWNGSYGGLPVEIKTNRSKEVFAFSRTKDGNEVIVLLNLSKDKQIVKLFDISKTGTYENVFTALPLEGQLFSTNTFELEPWKFEIWTK